jgi:hypothetical protein
MSHVVYHYDLIQGTSEWLDARLGLLTASEMAKVLTPTLKIADNAASKTHLFEMMAQRLNCYAAPSYISNDMLRGEAEEIQARDIYRKTWGDVQECGFVTNNRHGLTIGCSPDGLVGDDGMIEIKSRAQKYQMQTLVEFASAETPDIPTEFKLQVQTALFVTERQWCDFISICGGMPMCRIRVYPDPDYQDAICKAAKGFEDKMAELFAIYRRFAETDAGERLVPTERIATEMY